jgi:hypothetical protein
MNLYENYNLHVILEYELLLVLIINNGSKTTADNPELSATAHYNGSETITDDNLKPQPSQ